MLDDAPVDVVFSDIMMPGGTSGIALAREIRRRHPELPVVLATGYADSASSVGDGEFRVLLKPYSLDALSTAFLIGGPALAGHYLERHDETLVIVSDDTLGRPVIMGRSSGAVVEGA